MSVSEEAREIIANNNKRISELLTENEKILRGCGVDPPETNISMNEDEKIQIPGGYIRSKEYLVEKYRLDIIASNWTVRSNIGYAIQLSDFYNYIINRFHLWGSIETMFFKSAVINLISVFEAITLECANRICCYSKECKRKDNCSYSFNKAQRNNAFDSLHRMNELGITSFSIEEMTRIKELIDLRNRVHIRLACEKEFKSGEYNLALYNEVIRLLQKLDEQIIANGVSLYGYCHAIQMMDNYEESYR